MADKEMAKKSGEKKVVENPTPKIYAAIVGVMKDVGAVGKTDKNTQQNFMYRGIDAVMNALQPAMIKNKLFVVPTVLTEERTERTTTKGGVLFYTRLRIRYTFYAEDGSNIATEVIGEAMDSGDKATNKAMSIAYKYACFQVFCIPTEEMKDPDGECHEVAPKQEPQQEPQQTLYVDEIKLKVLRDKMAQKGVTESKILERYKKERMEDLTVTNFTKALEILDKMPDVQEVDLGL